MVSVYIKRVGFWGPLESPDLHSSLLKLNTYCINLTVVNEVVHFNALKWITKSESLSVIYVISYTASPKFFILIIINVKQMVQNGILIREILKQRFSNWGWYCLIYNLRETHNLHILSFIFLMNMAIIALNIKLDFVCCHFEMLLGIALKEATWKWQVYML